VEVLENLGQIFVNLLLSEVVMGKILIDKLLPSLEKMPIPETRDVTVQGRQTYEIGLEKVDEYRGDPKPLIAALRIFQTGNSQPYLFAGVAYTLVTASRENNETFDQNGLEAAMAWLEKAQELAPDVVDINMIEAFIYVYGGRFEDARLVLDYLENIEPDNFYLIKAEAAFWRRQEKLDEAVRWYEKAIAAADNVPRKLRQRSRLADCYLEFGEDDKALEIYQEAVHFSKEDPWLWHNLSIIHFNKEDYKEATRYNRMALELLDFQEAREMEKALRAKMGTGGLVNRLFGR
jgi:tetratricopeptide (TPR) repeat protein